MPSEIAHPVSPVWPDRADAQNPLVEHRRWIAFAVVMAAIAFPTVMWITHDSPGISTDSMFYLNAAGNIRAALFGPPRERMVHFPPLYPIVLSIAKFWNGTPLDWGRWLNVVLAAVNTLLMARLTFKGELSRSWTGFWAVMAFVAYQGVLMIHSHIFSEPLYLCWVLLELSAFYDYFLCHDRWRTSLLRAAVFAALACLTRYAGAAHVMAGAAAVLLISPRNIPRPTTLPWLTRLGRSAVFGTIAAAPLILVLLHNLQATGAATGRVAGAQWIGKAGMITLLTTMGGWAVPLPFGIDIPRYVWIPMTVIIGITTLAAMFFIIRAKGHLSFPDETQSLLMKLLALFTAIYFGFILFSRIFLDHIILLDWRMLSPMFATLLLFNAILIHWFWTQTKWVKIPSISFLPNRPSRRILQGMLLFMCFSIVGVQAVYAGKWANTARWYGMGHARAMYRDPELHAVLSKFSRKTVIYTNAASALQFWTPRPVRPLPMKNRNRTIWNGTVTRLRSELSEGKAVVVIFQHIPGPNELTRRELVSTFPLKLIGRGQGWTVYVTSRPRLPATTSVSTSSPATTSAAQ